MRVKPQLGENKYEIIKLCGFIKNWWTLGRVLGFHPGFCGLRFQSTNSSVVELFLDDFHDDS